MNSSNALGFVGMGTAMELLPGLAPSWVAVESTIANDGRALWLTFMGAVMLTIGGAVLLRGFWAWLNRPVRPAYGMAPAPELADTPTPAWAEGTALPRPRRAAPAMALRRARA